MNFLNPAILFAAVAAIVPLIIHLFSKRKVKVIEFSSVKHLKEMQKRQIRRLKIRQLLLLLLRMLIILAVVMAFARPTTETGNLSSHASVSAVMVVDNSASMTRYVSDGNLFELAKNSANNLLTAFGKGDELAVIPLVREGAESSHITFGSAASAKEALDEIKPVLATGNLRAAISGALSLLDQAANYNKELYIISDRQRGSLPDSAFTFDEGVHVYIIDLPLEGNDNIGITGIDFGGKQVTVGQPCDIQAFIQNYGAQNRNELIASLFIDGQRVQQTSVTMPAGQQGEARFMHTFMTGGLHSGYVELSDDPLLADNRYYFGLTLPDHVNVLLANGDNSGAFIGMALTPPPSSNPFISVKTISMEELSTVNLFEYDILILAGLSTIPDGIRQRVEYFVQQGKSLWITFGSTLNKEQFNSGWSTLSGVTIEEASRLDFSRSGYYTLEKITPEHPIFSIFNVAENPLPEIKFFTLPKTTVANGTTVLAEFSGKRPALIEYPNGRGRVMTFTGLIDPKFSDIAGHAFFVPLANRTVEYLSAQLSSYDLALYTDGNIARTLTDPSATTNEIIMTTPDGNQYGVPPSEEGNSMLVRPRPTTVPGIYGLQSGGREIDRFAVNVNPAEGNLQEATITGMAAALGATKYSTLNGNATSMANVIAESRYGQELWQWFLWLAVILLFVEMLLSRSAPPEE